MTQETAIFAGGCFWCTEAVFQSLEGVESVESGYIGGSVANPTYKQLAASPLEIVIAGTEDAVLMVESGGREISEEQMLEALAFGHEQCKQIARIQKELAAQAGKPQWAFDAKAGADPALEARVKELATAKVVKASFDAANAAFKKNQWKDAVTYAVPATDSPDDAIRAEAWLLTGESELKLKRHAAAAKAFEEVGTIPGADAAVRYRALAGLGLAREELKDWRAAADAYDQVATKSTDSALKQWARDRAAIVKARLKQPAPATKPAAKPATKPKGGQ